MAVAAATVAVALAIAACGEKAEPAITTQATTTSPEAQTFITYRRTGGVAGIREVLAVTNDGGATLQIGYPPNSSSSHFQLTVAELRELHRDLAGADLKSTPKSACADCFQYTITTMTGTTTFDERGIPTGTQRLIALLGKLVADNIPAHAASGGTSGGK
jgi:hypothetical protein